MDRIQVAVFPNDARAYAGLRALEDMDRLGTITVYATLTSPASESRVIGASSTLPWTTERSTLGAG